MIKLTELEQRFDTKDELVIHWLNNNEIDFDHIFRVYVYMLEKAKENYEKMLSQSDVYISTLIDNNKEEMDFQRPYAKKYMLENERLKGTEWYDRLNKEEL